MTLLSDARTAPQQTHGWLRSMNVALLPGLSTPLLEEVLSGLRQHLPLYGHQAQDVPHETTDLILTTARYGLVLGWREAALFTARRRYRLDHMPTVCTVVHIRPHELRELLAHFERALAKEVPDPADYNFPGLAPEASRVLVEQGRRGGPMLAIVRLVQAQAKCLRVLLLVGEQEPEAVFHFDLVGAYPSSPVEPRDEFYRDLVMRLATAGSTREITCHAVSGDPIPRDLWTSLVTPAAMQAAGRALQARNFFTEMVVINRLVSVPAITEGVSSQYSEGCFATWDPELGALIATVTGSARPVDKGAITADDLAVIVGVRAGLEGALVRHVEGLRNDPPSSEAVELYDVDAALPHITLQTATRGPVRVPVMRSKLHGHRGVSAYHPQHVEYVPLDPAYYAYPVSCATDAQARGIKQAFARSQALRDPSDPRQVVFTVLPTHGAVFAEKWVPGTVPFQTIWQYMDAGYVQIDTRIPQGNMAYVPDGSGLLRLQAGDPVAEYLRAHR